MDNILFFDQASGKGSSINEVTVLAFKNVEATVLRRDDGGRGVKNCLNLRDIIYGRPLRRVDYNFDCLKLTHARC